MCRHLVQLWWGGRIQLFLCMYGSHYSQRNHLYSTNDIPFSDITLWWCDFIHALTWAFSLKGGGDVELAGSEKEISQETVCCTVKPPYDRAIFIENMLQNTSEFACKMPSSSVLRQ